MRVHARETTTALTLAELMCIANEAHHSLSVFTQISSGLIFAAAEGGLSFETAPP